MYDNHEILYFYNLKCVKNMNTYNTNIGTGYSKVYKTCYYKINNNKIIKDERWFVKVDWKREKYIIDTYNYLKSIDSGFDIYKYYATNNNN